MRRFAGVLASLALLGCSGDNPVYGICTVGDVVPDPSEVVIVSPSLQCYRPGGPPKFDSMGNPIPSPPIASGPCPSSTCLKVPLSNPMPPSGTVYPGGVFGLSTIECNADSDCFAEVPCVSGFTCSVAMTVGPECCKRFCICKDYVGPAAIAEPASCDPALPANSCCNLLGRTGNTAYPACGP